MGRGLVWLLALCGLGLGCGVPTIEDGSQASDFGELSLALRQSANGEVYRLQGATLTIAGAADETVVPEPDDDAVQVTLPVGDYTLALEPGFTLERQDGTAWEAVDATLASENPQPFTIAADAVTTATLRFVLDGETPVELLPGTLQVQLEVEASSSPPPSGCTPRLVINELDYDQEGTDTADFAELYNASNCALETAGLTLALINGGTVDAPSYATIDLSTLGASLAPGQYLVVGRPELAASLPAGTLLVGGATFAIQNGSPDGLRIERNGVVLDAMTYGGVIAGTSEGASAPNDTGAGALGRCPDGHDTGDGGADFAFHATPTPGAPNACP